MLWKDGMPVDIRVFYYEVAPRGNEVRIKFQLAPHVGQAVIRIQNYHRAAAEHTLPDDIDSKRIR